jgi:glycerol dehydrogenase-like iron-containing ADH family enzyme
MPSLLSPEAYPEFMQYLKKVVKGIKSSKDWEKVVEHKVGLALETLSHGEQSAVTTLKQLYSEVQNSSKQSHNQVAQYWNDLEKLHDQVEELKRTQEQQIVKALRIEGEWR